MDSFEGFRKSGTFTVAAGTEVQGDLTLDGAKTTLDLYARDFFSTHDVKEGCILGELHDRTKVSLIDCITTQGPGSGWRGKESYHFSRVFPHVVIFGKEHITATDRKIQKMSFHVDDAATLFYDFEAFGQVIGDRSHMTKIIEVKRSSGRDIEVGDDPMLFYFTGNYEIFKAETVLGTVSAEHRPSFHMPGPSGIKVDNKIQVCLSFKDVVSVDEALNAAHTLLRFLEIIAGRTQTVLSLFFLTSGPEGDAPNDLRVYWSMSPSHPRDEREHKTHPMDHPIQAARSPEYFANVLTSWLARDHEWRSARSRFSTAFSPHRSFNIDRLVSATNMFDILPASAVPANVPLTPELEDAKKRSRSIFKLLPPSPERESVLNALGRLGTANLKRKIRARAKLVCERIPSRFPELELVVDEAVDCRNYFVHGSKSKMDYVDRADQAIFFIEALEFIFAASDLVECGWDIEEWSRQGSTGSHPFNRLKVGYSHRLDELKRALATVKA